MWSSICSPINISVFATTTTTTTKRIIIRRRCCPPQWSSRFLKKTSSPHSRPLFHCKKLHNRAKHEAMFESIVGKRGVIVNQDSLQRFNQDWTNTYNGSSKIVVQPTCTEQVVALLQYCSSEGISVTPQGGNTGLVGGSTPINDEVVISLGAMNTIMDFDEYSSIVTCEAGVVLEDLESWATNKNLTVPLDLGAKGSCQIGGNIATNAGGLRYLRYGPLRGSVVGLEVVLGDGKIISDLRGLKKDNTGYSLRQIFIGSEGTLGIITKVALSLPARGSSTFTALLACNSYQDVLTAYSLAQHKLNEILSACEFFDADSLALTIEQFPDKARCPFDDDFPFYVLIETRGSNEHHDMEKIMAYLCEATQDGANPCVLAQSLKQAQDIWFLRENITTALRQRGHTHKYDMSLRLPKMYDLVEETRSRIAEFEEVVVCGYGHLGDGNLHLNVNIPSKNTKLENILEPFVYEWTAAEGGSISAEHGIGQLKRKYMSLNRSTQELSLMHQLKNVMDPAGILNPGKVLESGRTK